MHKNNISATEISNDNEISQDNSKDFHINTIENSSEKLNNNNNNRRNSDRERRRRINRMKTAIILIVIVLLLLPTILCIILGLKMNRLQKQVDELAAIHSQYGISNYKDENYAYAAVKHNDVITDDITLTEYGTQQETDNDKDTSALAEDSKEDAVKTDGNKISNENSKNKAGIYADTKVYLTFDDGPSIYTSDILDTLSDYNIKATFFVIGKTDEESKKLYKRIVEEGHTLGMHSYSHRYDKIYNSVEDFDKDFTKLRKLLYDTTGYKPSIYRFPGGSDNLVNHYGMEKFIKYLNEASFVYFDWNVENGDAKSINYTKDELVKNVLNGIAGKERAIVLMHDTQAKETTAASLPKLIEALIAGGAQILPLDKDVVPIQMIEADSVK